MVRCAPPTCALPSATITATLPTQNSLYHPFSPPPASLLSQHHHHHRLHPIITTRHHHHHHHHRLHHHETHHHQHHHTTAPVFPSPSPSPAPRLTSSHLPPQYLRATPRTPAGFQELAKNQLAFTMPLAWISWELPFLNKSKFRGKKTFGGCASPTDFFF